MIQLESFDFHIHNLHLRLPFRFGIVTLTAIPHLFVRAKVAINGQSQIGHSADFLAFKWFTKNPDSSLRDDVDEMITAIKRAFANAKEVGEQSTVFDLWWETRKRQSDWGKSQGLAPLLSGFGTTLVERALIDAFCRSEKVSFNRAVLENLLGIDLGRIHSTLGGRLPADFLPKVPLSSTRARQTVGLGDPIRDADIAGDERLHDGLPQSVEECIDFYGLTHLKIKFTADVEHSVERLKAVAAVLEHSGRDYAHSLDGNESFRDVDTFRQLWSRLTTDPQLDNFLDRLVFVEQPFHREVTFDETVTNALLDWDDRPALIIDEADSELDSLPRALRGGYSGTSHKNCKGVFKSIANASYMEQLRREEPGRKYILSAEDLTTIGPIGLLQDLAVVATLGIDHVERNGQHYFHGLSAFSPEVQETVRKAHGDFFKRYTPELTGVAIQDGQLDLGSIVAAPFGYGFDFDSGLYTPLEDWRFDSLGIGDA